MVRAVLDAAVPAESENTLIVEGNHYFPPEDIKRECLVESNRRARFPWKGRALCFDLEIDGKKI